MPTFLLPLLLAFLMTACATSPEGRSQFVAPSALQGFSAVYSELDMRLQLVTAEDAPSCSDVDCVDDRAFDQQVLVLGKRLADAAYRQYPDLISRFPRFDFIVADKAEAGSASSAGGTVVVFRGLRHLNPDDATLAFVLAREMSHVIAGHHDENVTTSILVAIATQILFPALNIVRGAAAVSGSAATSAASSALTTTAVTSAASFAGARVLRASERPQQVQEAESMAMALLAAAGWNARELTDQLEALPPAAAEEPEWTEELRESSMRVASAMQGPRQYEELVSEPVVQIATLLPELPPALVSRPF
ncbi:MAG: M48 family metalloprotease [Sulfuritalea sp.]|nr:M48 family metalloprotease [Sulfuritalea sp.]